MVQSTMYKSTWNMKAWFILQLYCNIGKVWNINFYDLYDYALMWNSTIYIFLPKHMGMTHQTHTLDEHICMHAMQHTRFLYYNTHTRICMYAST